MAASDFRLPVPNLKVLIGVETWRAHVSQFLPFWLFWLSYPVDTGRKLNVRKTFRRRPERLMYVQFKSCVYGDCLINYSIFQIANFLFPCPSILGQFDIQKPWASSAHKAPHDLNTGIRDYANSRGNDVSDFTGSHQKVAPYKLVVL